MKKALLTALWLMLITLGGCATTPVPPAEAKAAPLERKLAFQDKSDAASAALVVTRDAGMLGSGCFYSFWIDSVLAARLDVGETASFYVVPGEHVLGVTTDPQGKMLCSYGSDNITRRETLLRQDERKFYRLSINPSGIVDIQRSE